MQDADKIRDYLEMEDPPPSDLRLVSQSDLLLLVAAAISRSAETGLPFERSLLAAIVEEMDQPLHL